MENKITFQDMCEAISKHWADKHDIKKTPEEIFNYSSTGELEKVFLWYAEITDHNDVIADKNPGFTFHVSEGFERY